MDQWPIFVKIVQILQNFDGDQQELAILSILPSLKKLLENIASVDPGKKRSIEEEIEKLEHKEFIQQIILNLFMIQE